MKVPTEKETKRSYLRNELKSVKRDKVLNDRGGREALVITGAVNEIE